MDSRTASPSTPSKQVNSSIELIRLIAVILITFTHTRNDLNGGFFHFLVETLPTYGTAILSVVSGYLYFRVSRKKQKLFEKKVKSLAIPYLIANGGVLILALILNYVLGYNPLNRFSYDAQLLAEGLFALNIPPINPPTYFIRDIFIIFAIIALFTQRELRALLVLIPFVLFGTLVLRYDVAFLFGIGLLYGKYKEELKKGPLLLGLFILTALTAWWFLDFVKLPLALLCFVALVDLPFRFYRTGRYSYLLHLYHSPVIVITYPFMSLYISNPFLSILVQIGIAATGVYVLFLLTKVYKPLTILSGGR